MKKEYTNKQRKIWKLKRLNVKLTQKRKGLFKFMRFITTCENGVSFEKDRNKWLAQIRIDGKIKKLGRFSNEIDASNAYQKELETIL